MQKASINLIQKSRLNVLLNRIEKCCSNPVNRSAKNVLDEVNLQLTGKHAVLVLHNILKLDVYIVYV